MRLLFGSEGTFADILQGSQLNRLEIVNILGKIQSYGDVKKEKIPAEGKNKKTRSSYRLTHAGEKKLAEKVVKGEIAPEVYEKLRADLEIGKIERKKNELLGYG